MRRVAFAASVLVVVYGSLFGVVLGLGVYALRSLA